MSDYENQTKSETQSITITGVLDNVANGDDYRFAPDPPLKVEWKQFDVFDVFSVQDVSDKAEYVKIVGKLHWDHVFRVGPVPRIEIKDLEVLKVEPRKIWAAMPILRNYVPDEVLMVLKIPDDPKEKEEIFSIGTFTPFKYRPNWFKVKIKNGMSVEQIIEKFEKNKNVISVEPNHLVSAL
jgi:hypothetical protein